MTDLDLRRDGCVQFREPVDGAAPHDLHLAVARIELRGRVRERAVLHHEAPGEHGGEHGRAGDDADRDEHEPLAARPEACADEPKRERDPNELRHRYNDSTGV